MNEAKAMNNMLGKDQQGDLHCDGLAAALEALEAMVSTAASEANASAGDVNKYDYAGCHLGAALGPCAGKTRADLHRAFCLWSQKPEDRAADSFNVSKAFRRLTAFAEYQLNLLEQYFADPIDLDAPGIRAAGRIMNMVVPQELHEGEAVVWVMDIDPDMETDLDKAGTSYRDLMRYFWALMLTSLFDDAAAVHGVIIMEGLHRVGFSAMMKLQRLFKPIEDDMNRMFYGVMPFKMKLCVILGSPWWLSALLGFMRLFISSKMSARIKNLSDAKMLTLMGGADNLPAGVFGGTRKYVPRYPSVLPMPEEAHGGSGAGGCPAKEEDEDEDEDDDEITL